MALGLGALGVFIFVILQMPSNDAGPPPTTATYDLNNSCVLIGCHDTINATFNQTAHAIAYPDLVAMSPPIVQLCVPCHVVGAGHPSIYPSTGYNVTTGSPTSLQNVTCQACHGPGSLHLEAPFNQKLQTIGLVMNSSLCGSCHSGILGGTHHPTYTEWNLSGHAEVGLPDYVKGDVQCANCHESWMAMKFLETGSFRTSYRIGSEDAPLTWEIGCPTCHDPHSVGANGYAQLRVDENSICQRCHNAFGANYTDEPDLAPHHPMAEMRNNTAGYGIDRAQTDYMTSVSCFNCHMGIENAGLPNHTFMPNPTACLVCHDSTGLWPNLTSADQAQAFIDSVASKTNGQLSMGRPLVDEAIAAITQMAGNRTDEDLSSWMTQYKIAKFNFDSVDLDMSHGDHNPGLASKLLVDSMARSNSTIENLTPPNKVTGVTVEVGFDGTSIDIQWTTSDATDFAKYRIYVLSFSRANITSETWLLELTNISNASCSVTGLAPGTYYVYVTAVDTNGNEITNTVAGVPIILAAIPEFHSIIVPIVGMMIFFGAVGIGRRYRHRG